MKSAMRWIVALVLLSAGAAHAQDVTGAWQGTLDAGGTKLRLVFTISGEGGTLRGVFYSIDQASQGIAATPTFQNATLRIAVAAIMGSFEGKLATDGVSRYDFTLTWTPDESQFRGLGVRVPPPSGDPNAPPGLFTAVQEQLGLKFESTNAPVDVLVVDRAERPSEN